MTETKLTAPENVSEFVDFIHEARAAGYSEDDIITALKATPYRWQKFYKMADAPDAVAKQQREWDDADRTFAERYQQQEIRNDKHERRSPRKAGKDWHRTAKVWRRITEDDPSIYGSRYLGREGEMAWMPR